MVGGENSFDRGWAKYINLFKKIFQILKGLNCFYRNYFSGIIFQKLFSVGEDGRKTDVKRTNSY